MLAFLFRSIVLGVAAALLLLLSVPSLRTDAMNILAQPAAPEEAFISYNSAFRKASPAVVNIYNKRFNNETRSMELTSAASGVIMSDKGYILTNYHVIINADEITVALQDGRIINAHLVGKDKRIDLAVLRVEGGDFPVIPQDPNYSPKVGDVVLAIGNPNNLGQTVTSGILSATGRSGVRIIGSPLDLLQTDAAINDGNSGGALVNSRGVLVGINTASQKDTETQGISFAIPYPIAIKIMKKLIADGRVIRGFIGISGNQVSPLTARLHNIEPLSGILVTEVSLGGPADSAGLQPRDLLIEIDNTPLHNNLSTGFDIVADLRPGTKTTVTVIRNGETLTLPIIIGEAPLDP
ncbi:outer membrane-stress sensor serine endopeptidase DegS [Veronia nyctiphanis]|uniref:Outer membrane-stress sensor serine endopeptidase DegS n=1 Tax=Veronia nyctiphanis TaxID=1278244 RepID=A0A4Q0YPK6_9GAMM|nr:outer membrane-stress sensor serine endopeptidase DegS [Veronia nyctiphanis]RXJ71914.1 outer membrane-stress sensor serine endopeptidase DegS [Veronia nyctiphanis]